MNINKIITKLAAVDYKWYLIIILFLKTIEIDLAFLAIILAGMTTYPAEIELEVLSKQAGTTIGEAFTVAIQKTFQAGYNSGEALYPYNGIIAEIFSKLMVLFPLALIIFISMSVGSKLYLKWKK